MPAQPLSGHFAKDSSISRRFSLALIGVVTLLLLGFAGIVIYFDIAKRDRELNNRLSSALHLAQKSLPTPLWNLDRDVVRDFIEALFLNEAIVYARVWWEHQTIAEKRRPAMSLPPFETVGLSEFPEHPQYIAQSAEILYEERPVGRILIVMSRAFVRHEALVQASKIVALTLLLIAAICATSIFVTRKYISKPLLKLQQSASRIARGDLEAVVDKSGRGEIGVLAEHLDGMRASIRDLIGQLRHSKQELEAQSRNLEGQVAARTRELARSVEELRALGEVVQNVNSTLELETVLANIVRHAVQISAADAGTIYEFDEVREFFVPWISHGVSQDYLDGIRDLRPRVGDDTVVGKAAQQYSPVQLPDLAQVPDYPLEHVRLAGFRALLAVPLLRKDRLIGGLVLRRKTAGEFPAAAIDLLETFAAQSAMAIHNARLFREIEEKGRELETANRHKSEFLANMSHELRTPLNAILGYTELILDHIYGEVPEKIEEVLARLEKNGRHLLRLINDVLDLSKIEAGRLKLSLGAYSMAEVVQSASQSVEGLATEKGLDLRLALPPELPAGRGDAQRIAQVLLNLLGNAIKFTDAGQITVAVEAIDGMFQVAVTDTGSGLREEDRERVFEEFRQVDGSSTREKGGTGLGLAIARKIVNLHGGRIWVESSFGEGATFYFTLPVWVEKQKET